MHAYMHRWWIPVDRTTVCLPQALSTCITVTCVQKRRSRKPILSHSTLAPQAHAVTSHCTRSLELSPVLEGLALTYAPPRPLSATSDNEAYGGPYLLQAIANILPFQDQ